MPSQLDRRLNLKDEATLILSLVATTGERYSSSYLIRLLRGDDAFPLQDPAHLELETFGCMPEQHSDRLRNVIRYLVRQDLLRVLDPVYGVLALTPAGERFLETPHDLIATYQTLRYSPFERLLLRELRDLRRRLADEEGHPPFRIFTDYVMQRLVEEKPDTLDALRQIPGFGDYKVNRYGPAVLQAVPRAKEMQREVARLDLLREAQGHTHQETKALFEAGFTDAEIAAKRSVKPATVRKHLINLHRAGEIDLTPWIESTVDGNVLEKGSHYFRHAESRRLREAYETLGLDYETLRLCRLYVASMSSQQTTLRSA